MTGRVAGAYGEPKGGVTWRVYVPGATAGSRKVPSAAVRPFAPVVPFVIARSAPPSGAALPPVPVPGPPPPLPSWTSTVFVSPRAIDSCDDVFVPVADGPAAITTDPPGRPGV